MHKYTVEFRISGEKLIPSAITKELELEPCQTREIGEIGASKRRNRKALWSYNGFSVDAGEAREWDSLEEGLFYVLKKISLKQHLIQPYLTQFEIYWWCGHFQQSFDGGPTFSPELLRKLADVGVPLILDNYFSDAQSKGSGSNKQSGTDPEVSPH